MIAPKIRWITSLSMGVLLSAEWTTARLEESLRAAIVEGLGIKR